MEKFVQTLKLDPALIAGGDLPVRSPIDGAEIARVRSDTLDDVAAKIALADAAFEDWRCVPAPKRGELIRLFGEELRVRRNQLGELVTMEAGKIAAEGLGEVQEMIDMCDFAVGLSRQLYGLTMASERPGHHLRETWHPLGAVGVITAFNFPVAPWAWNFCLAIVCGDPVVWKPSEQTPVSALACQAIFRKALARFDGDAPEGLLQVVLGGADVGQAMVDDPRLPLISATGSCAMGKTVYPRVASRLGRCLLELGGNNGAVVGPTADLDLTVRAVLFAAVGTAGQRCTTLRRLIVHESIKDELVGRLAKAYGELMIGSPLDRDTLVGPLIGKGAFEAMQAALKQATAEGGKVLVGGERVLGEVLPDAWYVRPAIVEMPGQTAIVKQETFAPILYVMSYRDMGDAIRLHNGVDQGLSSAIFTNDLREAERFMSAEGSDCGICNVNAGPSGAEIGGAFGGEKDTGGGREAGSDAWKSYMRRQTNTINYSTELPLAQGIDFGG